MKINVLTGCLMAMVLVGCAMTDPDFDLKKDGTIVELNEKISDLEKKNKELENMNGDLKEKIKIVEKEKATIENTLTTIKEEYEYYISIYTVNDVELADIIAKYENTIKEYQNKIDSLDGKIADYEKHIIILNGIISGYEEKIINLTDTLRSTTLELAKYKELLEKSNGDTTEVINGYKRKIAELEKDIINLNYWLTLEHNNNNELRATIDKLNKTINDNDILINKYVEEIKRLEALNADYETQINYYVNLVDTLTEDNERYKAEIETLKKRIETLEKNVSGLENENKELKKELAESKTICIYGWPLGCDKRNWLLTNGATVNNIDLKNGYIKYGEYKIYFVEM